ncbi:TPA: hypothetical protein ACGQK4_003690, partial [Elizabethkingia anophelis]
GSNWSNSPTNYGTGVNLGGLLFLPAAGYRNSNGDGSLFSRGILGVYWSSSFPSYDFFMGGFLNFDSASIALFATDRLNGFSVRCIVE